MAPLFRAGDEIRIAPAVDPRRFTLRRNRERIGVIAVAPGRPLGFGIGDARWSVVKYARGWALAAHDPDDRRAAWYAERWILPGRMAVGDEPFAVLIPMAWRGWTLRHGRRTLLTLEPKPRDAIEGTIRAGPPAGNDPALLFGFFATVVLLRIRYPRGAPLPTDHAWESRADALDTILDGLGGDGGGGDG